MGATRRNVNARIMGALWLVCTLSLAGSAQPARAQSSQAEKPIRIVAFGDSLTAGYQLPPDAAFPVVLEKALRARGFAVEVINAGVSGDTTAAGLERLAWAVPPDVDAVILELGANDALRGLDPGAARKNLAIIIETIKAQKTDILFTGMIAPRSFGDAYTKPFDAMYPELAKQYGLLFYPFFPKATALQPKLSLPDGLHPNAQGVAAIVADILPVMEELIARVKLRRTQAAKG